MKKQRIARQNRQRRRRLRAFLNSWPLAWTDLVDAEGLQDSNAQTAATGIDPLDEYLFR